MSSQDLLCLILGLVLFDYIIDRILSFLNYKSSKSEVPVKLKGLYNHEEYKRSQDYQSALTRFGFISSLFSTTITVIALALGVFGYLDGAVEQWTPNPMFQSLLFFGVLFLISDIINLPFPTIPLL